MSKQLVLQKIEHLQNELINLKESVEMLGITDESTWKEKFWTICRIKYNVDYNKMIAKGKSEPIVFIRQIYAYLLHRNMFLSDKEIAVQIDRERSTVVIIRQGVESSIKLKEPKFMRVYKHFKHLAQ